jgi:predicted Zn-dependent peptidase
MRKIKLVLWLLTIAFCCNPPYHARASALQIDLNVQEFKLSNGMLFLVVERPSTPQVAVRLAIRAGSAFEAVNQTGIAHMLEHMMFKGTANFGSLDPERDQQLQTQIENAYQTILSQQSRRRPDQSIIEAKRREMEKLRKEVQKIYVPQVFSSQLARNGAVGINAFTSTDQTQYLAALPSDMVEQWFAIISEQLFEPAWREFYVEKEVVKREWAYRYINNPAGAAWLDLYATAFTAHPYRNPVIGWQADIERFNTQAAKAFHKRFYTATNAVCVLVGDITLDKARQLAETYFSRYPAGEPAPELVTGEPRQDGPRQSIRYLKGARTPTVRIGYHIPEMGTDDFYALDALAMVLTHGRSARLSQRIVNKGLAVEAWAYNPDSRFSNLLIVGGSPNEPATDMSQATEDQRRQAYLQSSRALVELLSKEIETLKQEAVGDHELARIKKLNQREFIDRMRSNERLAETLVTLEIQRGWRYLDTYLARLDAVSAADIMRVAQKYLHADNQTTVYVLPGGTPDTPPQAYSETRTVKATMAERPPASTAFTNRSDYPTPDDWKHPLSFTRQPAPVTYPESKKIDLSGSHLFFLPDTELPIIDLKLLVKAGSVDDPVKQAGLMSLLGETLVQGGTRRHTPQQLAQRLDENAIKLAVRVGKEETTIQLSVLKQDWSQGLAILHEILTEAAFDPAVLAAAKNRRITELNRQQDDAQTLMHKPYRCGRQ